MNEQLIVKNFGPIKDATVDFKRVTVFIGPTGGGKSTLAKLAAVFRDDNWLRESKHLVRHSKFNRALHNFQISDYLKEGGEVKWNSENDDVTMNEGGFQHSSSEKKKQFEESLNLLNGLAYEIKSADLEEIIDTASIQERAILLKMEGTRNDIYYIPADRAFAAAIEFSLAGLVLQNVALPAMLLSFINEFKKAQVSISHKPLEVSFLNISYREVDRKPMVDIGNDEAIELTESASGVQAVVPMLLVINQSKGQWFTKYESKSFIIEEPELNLYPTAQQGLLNWLVEKCTKGENDLTITTHSPYILSHLNLLLYAYQVAEKHPDRKEAIAAIVPEASWINPKEFACYQVENGGVKSLVNEELGLIDENGLDNISGDKADAFDQLISINRGFAHA